LLSSDIAGRVEAAAAVRLRALLDVERMVKMKDILRAVREGEEVIRSRSGGLEPHGKLRRLQTTLDTR
jgi:hypothetical protein